MSENQSSYRQIFKATSIFGGVQVFNILISIFRSKFIAVFIGPAGIGIFGLLTSTLSLISSLTSFGLGASAVKDIAYANESKDDGKLFEVGGVLNKLVWYTGGLGMILTLILAPFLSKLTFDNYNYTWSFVFLSATLLIGQLTLGKDAVLQGTRQLKWLAYANMVSSVASLLVTVPLYYFYGVGGIVPAIVVLSVTTLIITQFYYSRLKFAIPSVNIQQAWIKGKGMLRLGFFLSLSGIIASACSYLVRIFITKFGGIDQVGFYNAGFGIITSYVGIIFTAMATDYFPRLSGVSSDKKQFDLTVNQQGEIALIILGPVITGFLIFGNLAIIILYSTEFLPILSMMQYAIVGVFFKAASWLLGFIFLAKGDTKIYFWSELSANIYQALLNCTGFYYGGLEGLGISFIAGYLLYLIQMVILSKYKYKFQFQKSFLRIFIFQIIIAAIAFAMIQFVLNQILSYFLGITLIIIAVAFSIFSLNRIINIKDIIKNIKKRS